MESPRVLIVDDDPSVRDLLVKIVGDSGYVAHGAADGEAALGMLAAGTPYDAVLTDIRMPRLGGIDLVRRLKDLDPALPVVVITGYPTVEAGVNALKLGATDFLTKPFRAADIRTTLERVIHERRWLTASADSHRDSVVGSISEALHRKIRHISMLSRIGESIERVTDNAALLDWMVCSASDLTGAREVTVGFLDEGVFVVRRSTARIRGLRVPVAGTPMERLLSGGTYHQAPPGERSPYGAYALDSSLLTIPLRIKGETIGFLNLSGKPDGSRFTEEEISLAVSLAERAVLKFENNALYESLYTNFTDTLKALVSTIEARDSYTGRHSERVTRYALEIADRIGLGLEERDAIKYACYLHDIGKIGVRDIVLLKPGRLTPQEFRDIRQHPVIGDSILKSLAFLPLERAIIRHHHERWDGSGYPDGLRGAEIPLLARVAAVADAYDALTSTRPYRGRAEHEAAVREIRRWTGRQFDPDVVEAFLETGTGRRGPLSACPAVEQSGSDPA